MKISIVETVTKYFAYEIDDSYEQNLTWLNNEFYRRRREFDDGKEVVEEVFKDNNIQYDVVPHEFSQSIESIDIDEVFD